MNVTIHHGKVVRTERKARLQRDEMIDVDEEIDGRKISVLAKEPQKVLGRCDVVPVRSAYGCMEISKSRENRIFLEVHRRHLRCQTAHHLASYLVEPAVIRTIP